MHTLIITPFSKTNNLIEKAIQVDNYSEQEVRHAIKKFISKSAPGSDAFTSGLYQTNMFQNSHLQSNS